MAGSARRNLATFKKLIGNDALHNLALVTTMWDQIDEVKGAEREKALVDTSEFWGTMISHGSTVARFDGTKEGAADIVRSLLNRTTRTLNIQKEMIDDRLQLEETEAGKEVLANITELKLQHQREIRALRSDMEEALSQNDKIAAEALAEMANEYDRKLAIAQDQIYALQSRNPEIEALQIRHQQEIKSLKDSLEDRMLLEEQASVPPPAYAEAGRTIDEDVRDPAQSATSLNTYTSQSIIFHLWTLFIYF
jgi:DNA-binding ferritin-like protein